VAERTLYSIGEVAALLGVSPHTIRAWERRHGILRPERTAARQRRYRPEDIELLRDIKRAIDLNGFSLRLAFQAVSGEVQPLEAPPSRARSQEFAPVAAPGDAGLWRAIGDGLPQLIMVIDRNGTIVEANVAVARALGVVHQRLKGRKFVELVDPFDRGKAFLLYRPQLRTAMSWELNIVTRRGARLYSFQSWALRQDGGEFLALVGTEMYAEDGNEDREGTLELARRDPRGEEAVIQTLRSLLDRLPLGLAVSTIGTQPRIVYANGRLFETLGMKQRSLLGFRLEDLLPDNSVTRTLHEAVETGRSRALHGLHLNGERAPGRRMFDLTFRPIFSSNHRITGVLVVVENAGGEAVAPQGLSGIAVGELFAQAKSVDQLAQLGLQHLARALPDFDFIIRLTRPYVSNRLSATTHISAGWRTGPRELGRGPIGRMLDRVLATGSPRHLTLRRGRRITTVQAVPLPVADAHSPRKRMGVVAWRGRGNGHLGADGRVSLDAFLANLAIAAELLHMRAEAALKAGRWEAVTEATSVVAEPNPSATGLGVRFLERLTKALDSAGAAIGRVLDSADFVIEAAFSKGDAPIKRGERFSLRGHFIGQSIRSSEPTALTHPGSIPGLPSNTRRTFGSMKNLLSVPLVLGGQVKGAIVVWRTIERPFSPEDVVLVQTLSSIALLAVILSQAPEEGAA
jgi:PAS domain S-box-containing protein